MPLCWHCGRWEGVRYPEYDSVIEATILRISKLTGADAHHAIKEILAEAAYPEAAITRLERWLGSLATPEAAFEAFAAHPPLGRLLGKLFGLSRHLSEVLVQNAELAYLVLEPSGLERPLTKEELDAEADQLVSGLSSHLYILDRIRYLKQREYVRIALADLGGLWSQRDVWKAISDVADVCLRLTLNQERNYLEIHEPFAIIAYGKLGGEELNYSSDVDLVYVAGEGADLEKCEKLAKTVTLSLTRMMGRGAVHRVDLRLRPFGSRGALVPGIKSFDSYFQRHAETWELVALMRSRPICGDPEICAEWERLRELYAYPDRTVESEIIKLFEMRERSREDDTNLKLGPGGIRDVEVVVQSLQYALAGKNPDLRVRHTLDALRALTEATAMPESEAERLAEHYTSLRKVEHRIQIIDSEQTQKLPEQDDRSYALAKSLGYRSIDALIAWLDSVRAEISASYNRYAPTTDVKTSMQALVDKLGDAPKEIAAWVALLSNRDAYADALVQNRDSLDRLIALHERAPSLMTGLSRTHSVLEQVISGEILEFFPAEDRFGRNVLRLTDKQLGERIARGVLRIQTRWTLDPSFSLGEALAKMFESAIGAIAQRTAPDLRIVALGSLAAGEVAPYSDVDLTLFVEEPQREQGSSQARALVAAVSQMRESGAPLSIDLRLRPGGAAGSLVTTPGGYIRYAHVVMEPWERLAALRFREIVVPSEASQTFSVLELRQAAIRTLDQGEMLKLLEIKDRIERERVPVQHRTRHIKLGHGGLDDIEWRVGTSLLGCEGLDPSRFDSTLRSRVDEMVRLGLVDEVEADQIVGDFAFTTNLRARLSLFGHTDDVLPENPDKLQSIAMSMNAGSANELLAACQEVRDRVRASFEKVRDEVRAR